MKLTMDSLTLFQQETIWNLDAVNKGIIRSFGVSEIVSLSMCPMRSVDGSAGIWHPVIKVNIMTTVGPRVSWQLEAKPT